MFKNISGFLSLVSLTMFFIGSMVATTIVHTSAWVEYDILVTQGRLTLWVECGKINGSKIEECWETGRFEGPAFLDAVRTLACLLPVAIVPMWKLWHSTKKADAESTVKVKVKALSGFGLYFLFGCLLISASTLYRLNYREFYDDGTRPLLSLGHALIGGFVAGSLSILNCVFMIQNSKVVKGMVKQFKSKICSRQQDISDQTQNNNDGITQQQCQRPVDVRSRLVALKSPVRRVGMLVTKIKSKMNGDKCETENGNQPWTDRKIFIVGDNGMSQSRSLIASTSTNVDCRSSSMISISCVQPEISPDTEDGAASHVINQSADVNDQRNANEQTEETGQERPGLTNANGNEISSVYDYENELEYQGEDSRYNNDDLCPREVEGMNEVYYPPPSYEEVMRFSE